MQQNPTRIIIDTNILISAYVFGGTPSKVLNILVDEPDNYLLFISKELINELSQKFLGGRLELIMKKAGKVFDERAAQNFLELYTESCVVQTAKKQTRFTSRDPKDNMLIDLALTVQSDYIITGDKDLLVMNLVSHLEILGVGDFLLRI